MNSGLTNAALAVAAVALVGCETTTLAADHASMLPQLFSYIVEDNFEDAFKTDPRWKAEVERIKALPTFRQEREMAELTKKARRAFYTGDDPLGGGTASLSLAEHALLKPKIEFMELNGGRFYYKLTFSSPKDSPPRTGMLHLSFFPVANDIRFAKERIVSAPTTCRTPIRP